MTTIGQIVDAIAALGPDEQQIVAVQVERLTTGRKTYGEWKPRTDPRDNPREALAEILDACQYLAAQLITLSPAADPEDAAPTVGEQTAPTEIKPSARVCLDCGCDISDRNPRATYCAEHAAARQAAQKRAWAAKHAPAKEAATQPAKRPVEAPAKPQKVKRAPALIRDASAKGKRAADPVIEGMRAQLAKTVRKVDPAEEQARQSTTKRGGTPGRPGPRPASEVVSTRDGGGTVML